MVVSNLPRKRLYDWISRLSANLAAAIALRARDDTFLVPGLGKEIVGQLLQTPQVVHPAVNVCAGATLDGGADRRALSDCNYGLHDPPNDERISPLSAASHAGLPRAFIQVFGMDPLRDEGLLYACLLRDAGVLNIYPGVPHMSVMVFIETEVAAHVERDVRDGLRWLLSSASLRGSSCDDFSYVTF
ncbi:hypothetical protein C8Q70DRAFT_94368 [Cubamyces menziesii]|nr:hypothetical protein C8Q70DRAFT_94368 [Cubamyces menziesii]